MPPLQLWHTSSNTATTITIRGTEAITTNLGGAIGHADVGVWNYGGNVTSILGKKQSHACIDIMVGVSGNSFAVVKVKQLQYQCMHVCLFVPLSGLFRKP